MAIARLLAIASLFAVSLERGHLRNSWCFAVAVLESRCFGKSLSTVAGKFRNFWLSVIVVNCWNLRNCRCLGLFFFCCLLRGFAEFADNTTELFTVDACPFRLTVRTGLTVGGDMLTVTTKGCSAKWLTVYRLGLTVYGLGLTVRRGSICTESLVGLLDTEAWDLLWLRVDNSGLSVYGLTVDGPGLSIDRLTVNWLHTVGGLRMSVGNGSRLDMSWCEAILSLSLCLTHLTKEANRSLFLGSTVVEATNETEVHGL